MAYPGPQTKITITHDREVAGDLQAQFITQVMSKEMQIAQIQTMLNAFGMGSRMGSIALTIDDGTAVAATGTVTLSGVGAAGDTVVINGVTLTAVASGAVNNQWNVGGSSTISATNLAAAINASTSGLVSGTVSAASVTNVVTLTALALGQPGNAVTLAATGAGAASGARLTGGVASASASSVTYKHGV